MNTLEIIFATIAGLILLEGLTISIFPRQAGKAYKEIFKNKKNAVKLGLAEIILALMILFVISL